MSDRPDAAHRQFLLVLALAATLALVVFLSPMRSVLIWAVALGILFGPGNERRAARFGNRSLASLVTVFIAVFTVMLPLVVMAYFSREQFLAALGGLNALADDLPAYTERAERALSASLGIDVTLRSGSEAENAARLKQIEDSLSAYALQFGGAAITTVIQILSTLYVLFFFLRDWRQILGFLSGITPLRPAHKARLTQDTIGVINATLRGTIIVAALQAGIAGLIYLALGVDYWALLAVLTFIVCLMPAIGSGAVWIPVSLYFLFNGQIAPFWIMLVSGFLVIGMIDNFLRPRLIGRESDLPDFLIFLMSFGGLALMGIDGLLLGPVVAKVFIDLWALYVDDAGKEPAAPAAPGAGA